MTQRSQSGLVQDAIWTIQFGWRRHKWLHAEAKALLEAYFEAKTTISQLNVETQRLRDDAAAQRALVERLTNELDQRK